MAVLVNGLSSYTLPGTLPSRLVLEKRRSHSDLTTAGSSRYRRLETYRREETP
ncbi:MAG: hypothetical protein H0W52_09975 [Rubrobacteraceae bacterium]|nr:hypothetical protein [Rubrobacteraceae bacterium]